jgi:putative ABC transport system permease protein
MLFGETVRVALEALRANKMRSFLTMLGIMIGVAAVIAMVALGRGAERSVKERIASLGTTLLSVFPGQIRMGGVSSGSDRAELLMSDAEAIERQAEHVLAVQPEMSRSGQVQYRSQNSNTTIVGTTANYLEVRKFKMEHGRMFRSKEDDARKRYAVLGSEVVTELGVANPATLIGAQIRINGVSFDVIGVLESKGQGGGFSNPDDQILVPIQTARDRLTGSDRLRSISVLGTTEADIPKTMAEVTRILRREHRLAIGQEDDFRIRNQADFISTLGETSQIFSLLLAGIAAVSLIVGGIGIMNIMLVSVTERTREIGVRKALGATRRTILLQFLIEALVLCILGGAIGVTLGVGAALGLRYAFAWDTAVDMPSVLVALFFSATVGLLFGVWPARRAAALDPIESLRHE